MRKNNVCCVKTTRDVNIQCRVCFRKLKDSYMHYPRCTMINIRHYYDSLGTLLQPFCFYFKDFFVSLGHTQLVWYDTNERQDTTCELRLLAVSSSTTIAMHYHRHALHHWLKLQVCKMRLVGHTQAVSNHHSLHGYY